MEEQDINKKREQVVDSIKNLFSSKKVEDQEKSDELTEKRAQLIGTIKEKKHWFIYVILAAIIWFGAYIRTRNIWLLKDVTTGEYIPLALDPHLFLKYAKYIVEYGSLLVHDASRFVPLGTSTINYVFMSYFLAYLYKIINFIFPNTTLEYVDIIYPVICFIGAMIFFYLLVKRLFDWKVGLLATLFLSIIPAFIHRTLAGFSDHEALGIMLMFMAMYFYVIGWQSKTNKKTIFMGVLAGIFTGFMGLSWGGWKFLVLIISLFVLIELFFDKIKKRDVYQYIAWIIALTIITTLWVPMFSLGTLLGSFTTGIAFLVLFMLIVDLLLFKYDLIKIKDKVKGKMPTSLISLILSFAIGIGALLIILGPSTIFLQVEEISDNLLHPLGNDRWQLTVAEQHQPYFTDWMGQFGPTLFSIPLYLTLFMLGSIILFYNMVKENNNKYTLTLAYTIFILAFILSRYSPSSLFNGTNPISLIIYLGSLGVFALLAVVFYLKSYYQDKESYQKILDWDKKYIFILVWFIIMVIAARGAVRLFFIFAPITAVMASYSCIELGYMISKIKKKAYLYLAAAVLIIILVSPLAYPFKGIIPAFGESSLNMGRYSGPSYNQQWQIAGTWARENTPEDAIFGHWWDYGYWVQNGFERASVLDGANKIKYWNYLMGRHVLTAQSQEEALEFLYVHETTHYLIISDEIGKYTAYSSIGSNEDYDRYSWITTFAVDDKLTRETRNSTLLTYQGVYVLDDDFIWEDNVYPKQESYVGAVFLPINYVEETNENETTVNLQIEQPTIALINGNTNQRVDLPLECVYFNEEMILFEEEGYGGCLRIVPTYDNNGNLNNDLGAGLFVSEEGVNALWVNLYVFNQDNPEYNTSAFNSIYQDSYVSDLIYYNGRVMGPIMIWEIDYPEGFSVDQETEEKYLGGNGLLPDYFFDVN
jgi:asparagine N-glycosylation enzyme membrane subunit Stt3